MAEHACVQTRRARLVAVVLFAMIAVVALVLTSASLGSAAINPDRAFFDEYAQTGQAPNKTPEEQRAELNRVVEEGVFCISIASVIDFTESNAAGKAYIENVPGNPYDMKVEITLQDTGESVYASKGIAPNSYIEDIQLTTPLDPGSYNALATFVAYDRDTHTEVCQAKAEVVLLVGEGYAGR